MPLALGPRVREKVAEAPRCTGSCKVSALVFLKNIYFCKKYGCRSTALHRLLQGQCQVYTHYIQCPSIYSLYSCKFSALVYIHYTPANSVP